MTLPRKYEPADPEFARWVRDVHAILTRGLRWSDQIGQLVTMRYGGGTPYDVQTSLTARPMAVLCLEATKRDDRSQTESGARVVWAWRDGQIRIHSIDLSSAVDEYDVTLGILQG